MDQKGDSDEHRFDHLQIGERFEAVDQPDETMAVVSQPKSRLGIDHQVETQKQNQPKAH